MQSFENAGFAVELFVIFFGALCWLITPAHADTPAVLDKEDSQEVQTTPCDRQFVLTPKMEKSFYNLLDAHKVKKWGEHFGTHIVTDIGDTVSCPIVQYLLQTGVYESVDITTQQTAWFWTFEEISEASEEQFAKLENLEKHHLALPEWVTLVIPEFDQLLEYRPITGNDVIQVIDEKVFGLSTDNQTLEAALEKLSLKDARKLVKNLIVQNVVQTSTALKGKGCNTQYFVDIVRSHLSQHREAIAQTLQEITGQTVA